MWLIRNNDIDNDGIDVFNQCAVLVILDVLLEMTGAHDYEEDEF